MCLSITTSLTILATRTGSGISRPRDGITRIEKLGRLHGHRKLSRDPSPVPDHSSPGAPLTGHIRAYGPLLDVGLGMPGQNCPYPQEEAWCSSSTRSKLSPRGNARPRASPTMLLVLDRGEASFNRQSKKQLMKDRFQNGVVFSSYEVHVLKIQKYYVVCVRACVRVCVPCLLESLLGTLPAYLTVRYQFFFVTTQAPTSIHAPRMLSACLGNYKSS